MTERRVLLVVNPQAGRGRVGRRLTDLEGHLRASALEYRMLVTEGPGHATPLVRAALDEGERFIVAVGGDGTVNEVVNAMLERDRPVVPDATLGVVAAGSGCDFVRTFDPQGDLASQVESLANGRTVPIDVGRITYRTEHGDRTTYFANIAEVGLGAANVARAQRLPRSLGGVRYLVSLLLTLGPYQPCTVRIEAGERAFEGVGHNVVVANGQFFGGGMRVSPRSDPSDGRLDVQVNVGPKRQAFTLIPKMYGGRHLPSPRIVELSGGHVRIDAERPLLIEADGEVLGNTPATFTVLARVLNLRVGPARSP